MNKLNTKLQYILEPYKGTNSRYTCPNCLKKKQFTRYQEKSSGDYLDKSVGICNRAIKCGYHFTPAQYLKNKHNFPKTTLPQVRNKPDRKPTSNQERDDSFIPNRILLNSLRNFEMNNFAIYLNKALGLITAEKVCGLYFLGTSNHWSGSNVFWQIDKEGRVRTGKVMLYNAHSGKRVKVPYPHINWVHNTEKLQNFNLDQCLFGEHLLKLYPDKPIALVESEKTAMISAGHVPDFNWLATGNLNNLSETRVKCLEGKRVTLYPDGGAFAVWKKKADQLSHIADFNVSGFIEKNASSKQLSEGYDIADYLIDSPKEIKSHIEEDESTLLKTNISCDFHQPTTAKVVALNRGTEVVNKMSGSNENENNDYLWDINRLEKYFKVINIPSEPIKLKSVGLITDVQKFIKVNLSSAKIHNGKRISKPYFERLKALKDHLEKT